MRCHQDPLATQTPARNHVDHMGKEGCKAVYMLLTLPVLLGGVQRECGYNGSPTVAQAGHMSTAACLELGLVCAGGVKVGMLAARLLSSPVCWKTRLSELPKENGSDLAQSAGR